MKMRNVRALPPPRRSTSTNSSPLDSATRCAISRTLSILAAIRYSVPRVHHPLVTLGELCPVHGPDSPSFGQSGFTQPERQAFRAACTRHISELQVEIKSGLSPTDVLRQTPGEPRRTGNLKTQQSLVTIPGKRLLYNEVAAKVRPLSAPNPTVPIRRGKEEKDAERRTDQTFIACA